MVTNSDITFAQARSNHHPKECLGFKYPPVILKEMVLEAWLESIVFQARRHAYPSFDSSILGEKMYLILRLLVVTVFAIIMLVFGCGYCLFSPKNPKHVHRFGLLFGKLSYLFGIKLDLRQSEASKAIGTFVYVSNHQSSWDLVTVSNAVRPRTVTVGKRSLAFIPIFGTLYWLTGNILIDRNNRNKAMSTIGQVIKKIRENNVSVWLFPEGTRSRGRGILPFKTGAFHIAVGAGVSIVPIVCSSTGHLSLLLGNNGHIIVEIMDPISIKGYGKEQVRKLSRYCHDVMAIKLAELDAEVAKLNKKGAMIKSGVQIPEQYPDD